MQVFIAGIMQGSRRDNGIESQDYRTRIASVIRAHLPEADILDPWSLHPNSVDYDDAQGKQTFMDMTALAGSADVLVAYVPTASMGTAIEIWEAYHAGAHVVTISPLMDNWVIKFLSHKVVATLDEFEQYVARGELAVALRAPAPR